MQVVRSLIAYQGNKYKLLPEILNQFPKDSTHLHDVFGGSGVVTINASSIMKKVYYNEHDKIICSILENIRDAGSPEELEERFDRCVKHFGLGKGNKDEFEVFLEHCNLHPHPLKWFVVSKHCYSNLLRFNRGVCTAQFGDRGFLPSKDRTRKFTATYQGLQGVKITHKDFRKYLNALIDKAKKKKLPKGTIVYLDPPYTASGDMVYHGTWSEYDDKDMFELCDLMTKHKIKWMMSNVFRHGDKVNTPLKKFAKKYKVLYLDAKYCLKNAKDHTNQGTEEVLIKNFKE